MLCDCVTGGGITLTFVFFFGKGVGCLEFAISYR